MFVRLSVAYFFTDPDEDLINDDFVYSKFLNEIDVGKLYNQVHIKNLHTNIILIKCHCTCGVLHHWGNVVYREVVQNYKLFTYFELLIFI